MGSYVYSFSCENEIQHFARMPEHTQGRIERHIVRVICDSFLVPADEDYLTARLLAQRGMHRAFFWAASQAVEKYLKAFLLMRGESVITSKLKHGHPIVELYNAACAADSALSSVNTNLHPDIKIHQDFAKYFQNLTPQQLMQDLEDKGGADNRYNTFGVQFNTNYLFSLDSFICGLRKLIGVPPIHEILKKADRFLLEAFYSYNPSFATEAQNLEEIPNEKFPIKISDSVTHLEYLIGPCAPPEANNVLKWLNKKMKLPPQVKNNL